MIVSLLLITLLTVLVILARMRMHRKAVELMNNDPVAIMHRRYAHEARLDLEEADWIAGLRDKPPHIIEREKAQRDRDRVLAEAKLRAERAKRSYSFFLPEFGVKLPERILEMDHKAYAEYRKQLIARHKGLDAAFAQAEKEKYKQRFRGQP